MKMIYLILLFSTVAALSAYSQKYFTRSGTISFYSEAPLEKIEAHNQKATSVVDTESGQIEFAVLIKAFQFKKALMQEHFNENYMESSKFPKAIFKGEILNIGEVNFNRDGKYPVKVSGTMTIRSVVQPLTTEGYLEVAGQAFTGHAVFVLAVADYNIKIPSVVRDNIARTVQVSVKMPYEPLRRSAEN